MSGDRRLTIREAALALNMSVATLYRRVADGSLKLEKDVGRVFVSGAEVERYRAGRGAWKK